MPLMNKSYHPRQNLQRSGSIILRSHANGVSRIWWRLAHLDSCMIFTYMQERSTQYLQNILIYQLVLNQWHVNVYNYQEYTKDHFLQQLVFNAWTEGTIGQNRIHDSSLISLKDLSKQDRGSVDYRVDKVKAISFPKIVSTYNESMGSVDLPDMLIAL